MGRAYVTLVSDELSSAMASVGTLSRSALADHPMAELLREGHLGDFLSGLGQLEGEPGAEPLEAVGVDVKPLEGENLKVLLASVLRAHSLAEAQNWWAARKEPDAELSAFIDAILDTLVLVERSDAEAMRAAATVGAAAAAAEGTVLVALVAAGHVGGVAILIVSPIGIVAVGAGAAYVTWRLFTHRRNRAADRA